MVDDEPDLQTLVRQKFRKKIRAGELEFEFAENGVQAIEKIKEYPEIHIVFSDINMPEMDGITLLRTLKEEHAERNLKVVMVSAYGDMENIRKAMNLGAFDFITKPIDFTDLENTLVKATNEVDVLEEAFEKVEEAEKEKDAALASKKFKEQFLANMSHEIRTPMNAILGFTNLLLKTDLQPEQNKYLKSIKISGSNLLAIINDILDLSKIEAGKMSFEIIPTNLDEVLDSIYETMNMTATQKGLKLVLDKSSDVPKWITADRVRLSQILINLMGNAIKFTTEGGVTLKVGLDGSNSEMLKFEVIDSGIGIPEDKIASIFESFSQASGDTTRKFGGTGLGLTISRQLVNQQGGTLQVDSTLGKGSNFHFTLPFEQVQDIPEENTQSESRPELKDISIILAEDNEFNQMVAVDTLEDLIPGLTIEVAENGKIVLDLLEKRMYDLILMDIQMPEMDGHEATETIRSLPDEVKKNIPIMAMTAHATQDEIQRCYDEGMNDYITKPFEPEDLLNKIAALVKKT